MVPALQGLRSPAAAEHQRATGSNVVLGQSAGLVGVKMGSSNQSELTLSHVPKTHVITSGDSTGSRALSTPNVNITKERRENLNRKLNITKESTVNNSNGFLGKIKNTKANFASVRKIRVPHPAIKVGRASMGAPTSAKENMTAVTHKIAETREAGTALGGNDNRRPSVTHIGIAQNLMHSAEEGRSTGDRGTGVQFRKHRTESKRMETNDIGAVLPFMNSSATISSTPMKVGVTDTRGNESASRKETETQSIASIDVNQMKKTRLGLAQAGASEAIDEARESLRVRDAAKALGNSELLQRVVKQVEDLRPKLKADGRLEEAIT